MNAQEAIKIITKDLESSIRSSDFFEEGFNEDMSELRKIEEALSIVLESAKLLHEEMIEKIIDDGVPYLKLKEGGMVWVTHELLEEIGIEEGAE